MNESWKKDDQELGHDSKLVAEELMRDKLVISSLMIVEENSELDHKLNDALLNGMKQGRRRLIKQRRKRVSLQMSAVAVCMLLMLTAFVRISPAFAAMVKEIPGFSGFVELIAYDQSLLSAINNDFIQPVNLSDERNGYKFTVNGVIADSQRIVLLYTVEGPSVNEDDTLAFNYDLFDENGEELMASIRSGHFFPESETVYSKVQDHLDILMAPDIPLPQEIQFKQKIGDEWLQVNVPIDHKKFAGIIEEIEVNQTIEVAGQQLTISSATITPLQVSIDIQGHSNNSKQLNSFIDLELVDEEGRNYSSDSGMGNLDNQITRHFQSSYFHKPKQLTLTAKGLMMTERDLTIVVNTDTKEIISAPDSKLSLTEVTESNNHIDVSFGLVQGDDPGKIMTSYSLLKYDSKFKDAEGNEYPFESNGSSVSGNPDGVGNSLMGSYQYRIPRKKYVQPLTFKVGHYPGYILEDIAVKIK